MPKRRDSDPYERSAGGMDYDDPVSERASSFGSTLATGGPEALFQEVEKMLPDKWREQIVHFPITAIALGVGIGVLLGLKKGTQIIAAGTSLVAAAATANMNQFMTRRGGGEDVSEDQEE